MISPRRWKDIKQIIVRLPDEIHQKLKIKVLQDNTSIQDVLYSFITEYIKETSVDESIRSQVLEIYGCLSAIDSMSEIARKTTKKIAELHHFSIYSSDDFEPECNHKNKKE